MCHYFDGDNHFHQNCAQFATLLGSTAAMLYVLHDQTGCYSWNQNE